MASPTANFASSELPPERFSRASVFLLLLTGVLCIVSTGKLDLLSGGLTLIGLLYKGHRWWNHRPPELSTRMATLLVTGYLAFFPFDIFILSRMFSAGSPNPALLGGLLAAVHFLLYIPLLRL